MISQAEKRFLELLRKPDKSKEEIEEKEKVSMEFGRELREEETPLIVDVADIGIHIESVWDFVNTRKLYPEAIEVLIKHLQLPYHHRIKEGIVRALTVKEAKGQAGRYLIDEYEKIPKEKASLRWAIGNAISIVADSSIEEAMIKIVSDQDGGVAREGFITALRKLRSKAAESILIDVIEDETVTIAALKALGVLRSKNAVEKITSLKNGTNKEIVKQADKALNKILSTLI